MSNQDTTKNTFQDKQETEVKDFTNNSSKDTRLYNQCERGCETLNVYNWLGDISEECKKNEIIEVRFKHTRKLFFRNVNGLRIKEGDIVAVEASPGHDIGVVSLTGPLVITQLKKANISPDSQDIKKVYRLAKENDIKKWQEAMKDEKRLLVKSREVANNLGLDMKIGDVEYQGDKTKAIFYYIADDRVDFREMIKILAEELKIRIEMRQIGARQEAGRIGGIGPCGHKLCCTSWMSNFVSVTTNVARIQDVSLNPQKLAGQCSKLKCCLNYEVGVYVDAQQDFPDVSKPIETENGPLYHKKTDILKRMMWFSFNEKDMGELMMLPVDRVIELYRINQDGRKIKDIKGYNNTQAAKQEIDYKDSASQQSITRFDKDKHRGNKSKRRRPKRRR
jgi:cell fate regulator YaaT (PSP1 superfamily)